MKSVFRHFHIDILYTKKRKKKGKKKEKKNAPLGKKKHNIYLIQPQIYIVEVCNFLSRFTATYCKYIIFLYLQL